MSKSIQVDNIAGGALKAKQNDDIDNNFLYILSSYGPKKRDLGQDWWHLPSNIRIVLSGDLVLLILFVKNPAKKLLL